MRSHALRAAAGGEIKYRFLRLYFTNSRTNQADYLDIRYSEDGGTTWLPSVNMTSNTTPSPLVASASSEAGAGYAAWKAMDAVPGTYSYWSPVGGISTGAWHQIDLGAGNGIIPNALKWSNYNYGGYNSSPTGLVLDCSTTGAFAGEEVNFYTVTGLPSEANNAVVIKTW